MLDEKEEDELPRNQTPRPASVGSYCTDTRASFIATHTATLIQAAIF